ncbi:unnamed protein product [Schistocephalus solidus]|uniref:Integrin beta-4 n=1 Tax=Schistocephalus solidus TaxID=70667 RepID=A0A183TT97_SCHSO|nr:unnamed protein product [Schistocephalus solidus]
MWISSILLPLLMHALGLLWPVQGQQALSPPPMPSAIASGSDSIEVTWAAPKNPDPRLGYYMVQCYRPGAKDEVITTVRPFEALSAEVHSLEPNTLYECALIAHPRIRDKRIVSSPSQRSSLALTWPAKPSEPTQITVTAVNSTAVQIYWDAPLISNGDMTKYEVVVYDSSNKLLKTYTETKRGVYSSVLNGFQPFTTVSLAVRAYTQPNTDNKGGGFGGFSAKMPVTLKGAGELLK